MKKTLSILILVCVLLGLFPAASAQAEEGLRGIQWDGVHAPLLDEFAGFTPICWTPIAGTRWGFVSLKRGHENILAGFTQEQGRWSQQFINKTAFPQGEMRVFMSDASGTDKWSEKGVFLEQPAVILWDKALYFAWSNGEFYENQCIFELDQQGVWLLSHYAHAGQSRMMDVTADALYFLEESKVDTKIKARINRDLRSFDLGLLPKSPQQARQPDALPPQIPAGFLEAWEMALGAGGNYPVYSAPDTDSLRGGRGKAKVSSKGWVQVFGRENDFIMVQYAIASGHYRVGYVKASALSGYWDAPEPLGFTRVPAKALRKTALTDDPLGQAQPLIHLKAGQEVHLLSKMGDYAYLETKQGRQTVRGFALLSDFDTAPAPAAGLRVIRLQTGEGEEEVLLKRAVVPKLGLSLLYDSQRLTAYEPGDFLNVDRRRIVNDDHIYLSVQPAQVALHAYEYQKRYVKGEEMSGMQDAFGQPIYPPVPELFELNAQAQTFYVWDGYRIEEMGTELAEQLPNFPQEAKTGFYACKDQQVVQVLCLETTQGSFVCTILYPQAVAHTWGTRLRYALNTLEAAGGISP
ncbi:MAG: hypothetical protein GXZ04_05070 [Clostridiales bacterium]|nr:hypothetical protein [Clostridiales bacterium]